MNLPVTAVWLAAIAAVIHILVGALQSNTLNAMLAKFSIPSIPSQVFPYLGLALGLGGGLVSGLQQGQTLSYALASAVMAMVTGGASALHAESMSGKVGRPLPMAPPPAK